MNNEIKFLTPFKRMCMTIGTLPSSFYASMSYYESMVWLYEYLKNEVIPVVNNNSEVAQEIQTAFTTLENYIEHYFENLDIQEEVNAKLDEMALDGTLADIVAEYVRMQGQLVYNTVGEMKLAENIQNGSFLKTYGYYSYNDGGGALYKARPITNEDVIDNMFIIALHDVTLVAELIIENNEISPDKLGAKGNGTDDDTEVLQACFDYATENYCNVRLTKIYKVTPQENNICLIIDGKNNQDHLTNNNIIITFDGNSQILTDSNTESTLIRFNCGKTIINNMNLKGIEGKTNLFDMARIEDLSTTESSKNSYNSINSFNLNGGNVGLNLEGATYYNTFTNGLINNCTTGIEIGFTKAEKAGLTQDSACNRNNFNDITFKGCTNGIKLTYADTTKFVNINFEGCTNGIYLDDPSKHPDDFPIRPLYFTNDNMFVNITFEVVSNQFYNNATGTKVINTSTQYKSDAWPIDPQTYIGGTDAGYSLEKIGRIWKNVSSQTAYSSSMPYVDFDDSPNGIESKTIFDYSKSGNTITNMNKVTFTFDLKDDSNVASTTYDSCYVKSMGGIVFLSAKVKFQPSTTTQAIRLYYPSTLPWITNITGSFSNINIMTIPVYVGINGVEYVTFARIGTQYIEVNLPTGQSWVSGKYNDVWIHTFMFRNADLY